MPQVHTLLKMMRTVLRYFRQHPWQRRALTLSMATILGVGAACLVLPVVRDMQILAMLSSEDPFQRQRGIDRAVDVGARRGQLIERIEQRLDSAGDLEFAAMVDVLSRLGKFHTPGRKGEQLDRLWQINFAANLQPAGTQTTQSAAQTAGVRRMLLHRIVLDGRDNAYVRRVLQLATGDPVVEIRSQSALLAARLGDDAALLRLLGDADGAVRAAAAIDAALAGRTACAEAIAKSLRDATNDEEQAALFFGLAKLKPEKYAPLLADAIIRAWKAGRGELLEKMLSAAPLLKSEQIGQTVVGILHLARVQLQHPPATALIAAGKMGLDEAEPFIAGTITEILARPSELTVGRTVILAAAVNASGRLNMPTGPLVEVIEKLWRPDTSIAMILSAEVLGKSAPQSAIRQPGGTVKSKTWPCRASSRPSPASLGLTVPPAAIRNPQSAIRNDKVLSVLRSAAERSDTPVPSAAAAVALFRLDPRKADDALRTAFESETYLAGDYVAWNLSRWEAVGRLGGTVKSKTWPCRASSRPSPASLGLTVPPVDVRAEAWRVAGVFFGPRIYNKSVRSNAAMMLALLARRTNQAGNVAGAVEHKLNVEIARGQFNPFLASSYRCALLVLGRSEFAEEVASLARASMFPKRRALTALILAGEPAGFDLVFADERFDPVRIDSLLTGRLMARVYSAVLPEMPEFDIDAPEHVRHWQCRIQRDYYLIGRRDILGKIRP